MRKLQKVQSGNHKQITWYTKSETIYFKGPKAGDLVMQMQGVPEL